MKESEIVVWMGHICMHVCKGWHRINPALALSLARSIVLHGWICDGYIKCLGWINAI
jgi:hypothetical protein